MDSWEREQFQIDLLPTLTTNVRGYYNVYFLCLYSAHYLIQSLFLYLKFPITCFFSHSYGTVSILIGASDYKFSLSNGFFTPHAYLKNEVDSIVLHCSTLVKKRQCGSQRKKKKLCTTHVKNKLQHTSLSHANTCVLMCSLWYYHTLSTAVQRNTAG